MNDQATTNEPAIEVPAGFRAVTQPFRFRRQPDKQETRDAITKMGKKFKEEDKDGKKVIIREEETATFLVPTLERYGIELSEEPEKSVIEALLAQPVRDYIRALVDEGKETSGVSWKEVVQDYYDRYIAQAEGGAEFDKQLVEDFCKDFETFLQSIKKPADGIKIMLKMVKAKFSIASTFKYLKGLPAIAANLENFLTAGCNENQQAQYGDLVVFLTAQIDKVINTKPEEGELF